MSAPDYASRDLEGAAYMAGLDAEPDYDSYGADYDDVRPEPRNRCICFGGFDPACPSNHDGDDE